jgi:hypothetical protein
LAGGPPVVYSDTERAPVGTLMKTAKALRLTIPDKLLGTADKVIE